VPKKRVANAKSTNIAIKLAIRLSQIFRYSLQQQLEYRLLAVSSKGKSRVHLWN